MIVNGHDYSLCNKCFDKIRWSDDRICQKCGKILAPENLKKYCRDCQSEIHIFNQGFSCAQYDEVVADIIRDMKYKDRPHYAKTIAKLMAERFFAEADVCTGELPNYDFIVNVPMNSNKKKKRGYDQAALIAKNLATHIDIPYVGKLIERKRDTLVMSALGLGDRNQNLTDAFNINCDMIKTINDSSLLLVDDVFTTGSTADACAKLLYEYGAKKVDVIVFAIGGDMRRNDESF